MAEPNQQLTFLSWSRERLGELATTTAHGRARGQTTVTLAGTDAGGTATTSGSRTLSFLLAGPADVTGLQPGAIVGRFPAPGAVDHESDRCPHVEFRDPALPWRYTPAGNPAATGHLHPWIVLVVGIEGDELIFAGDQAALSVPLQTAHPLNGTGRFPWAHVQVDGTGRRVARVLSGRALAAGTDYVAALVPAYMADGTPAWDGSAPVTVALYDHWRFRTATPPGSFEDLAARLQPGAADPTTGRAPVDYPRVPAAGDLEMRGALAPIGEGDTPLPQAVADDLDGLRTPARDEAGRPIVGLPLYGDAWHPDPDATTWAGPLNGDPRNRGAAGVGLEIGILYQEELAAEASAAGGALTEARQRIAHLGLGLLASRAVWNRRLPADPLHRLWVLGPGLGRVVTDQGSIEELATAPDRALPRGLFSSAARRVLRPGPARAAVLRNGPADPGEVLVGVNRCPDPPKPRDDGVVLEVGYEEFDERRRDAAGKGKVSLDDLLAEAKRLAGDAHPELRDPAEGVLALLRRSADRRSPAPWLDAMALLAAAATVGDDGRELGRLKAAFGMLFERWDIDGFPPEGLEDVLSDMDEPYPEEPPCRPVDLDVLAEGAADAFDPTGDDAPAIIRVLDTIDGVDPVQPLAPLEVCIGLDRPVWSDLQRAEPEWLLPGVGRIPQDAIIAVETNPAFIDALLTGLNTQLLTELRWRNIPVATGCTPLRVFWDRFDTTAGDRVDDIVGIHAWPATSALGAPAHRPAGATGRDLVVVIRGELFRRYPSTVVYLVTAVHGGVANFDIDPPAAAPRIFPSFQGRIGPDVTFFGFQGFDPEDIVSHWLVFEEAPSGFRFANDEVANPFTVDGATFADLAFADPVRVLIRGDALDPEGP